MDERFILIHSVRGVSVLFVPPTAEKWQMGMIEENFIADEKHGQSKKGRKDVPFKTVDLLPLKLSF